MFYTNVLRRHRPALLAGLFAVALSAHAAAPDVASTGLGQAWPNTPNVSLSQHWMAYRFSQGGVSYIQVNDTSGNVHIAVAYAGRQFMVLPTGSDGGRVSALQQPQANNVVGEIVYRDAQVQVTMMPQVGGIGWTISPTMLTSVATQSASAALDAQCTKKNCGGGVVSQPSE